MGAMTNLTELGQVWNLDTDQMRDLSHCQGYGRWDLDSWREMSDQAELRIKSALKSDPPSLVYDFGCGGGSNIRAILNLAKSRSWGFGEIWGIDISKMNINAARSMGYEAPGWGVEYLCYDPDQPESLIRDLPGQADLFISTYVYQHFPSLEYAKRITALLPYLVRAGGTFIIQIRISHNGQTEKVIFIR